VLDITWLLQLDGWKCERRHWGAMYIVFEMVRGQVEMRKPWKIAISLD
jgi:hypothetical protein